MIWEGRGFSYSFNLGLGMGVPAWASYYLLSPFNLIVILLPESFMEYSIVFMILLKLSVAGWAATFFFQKLIPDGGIAPLYCGICYGLCGYAITYYTVVMWLDALYLLPLFLYFAKRVADEGKIRGFVLILCAGFVINYYMSYMMGLFTFAVFTGYLFYSKKEKNQYTK